MTSNTTAGTRPASAASVDILRDLVSFDTTSRNSNIPLIAWVEQGTPPEPVTARARADNEDLPEALKSATRPLCAAPTVARYKTGPATDAASFACEE